jgi:hypothetical protein
MYEPWKDNSVQFARLLSEIQATQDLDIQALCESMDLESGEVDELFDRASEVWEAVKDQTHFDGAPVPPDQIRINGAVVPVVEIDFVDSGDPEYLALTVYVLESDYEKANPYDPVDIDLSHSLVGGFATEEVEASMSGTDQAMQREYGYREL